MPSTDFSEESLDFGVSVFGVTYEVSQGRILIEVQDGASRERNSNLGSFDLHSSAMPLRRRSTLGGAQTQCSKFTRAYLRIESTTILMSEKLRKQPWSELEEFNWRPWRCMKSDWELIATSWLLPDLISCCGAGIGCARQWCNGKRVPDSNELRGNPALWQIHDWKKVVDRA